MFSSIALCLLVAGVFCEDTEMAAEKYDTIVIGLGAAGATAASILARAGKKVLVLEAQNRIGGRVHTVPFGDGVVEVGAEWIHGTVNSRVYDLAVQNNITTLVQHLDFQVFHSDGTLGDSEMFNELAEYCLQVVDNAPNKSEPLGEFITRNLMDYLKEKKPELLSDKDYIEQLLATMNLLVDNYEASNDWNDVNTASKYEDLGGELHMSWHRHGYKTFFDLLLNTHNGGPGYPSLTVKLGSEVRRVLWPSEPSAPVRVQSSAGEFLADAAIVTVSLGVLKDRHTRLFSPPLPEEKVVAIDKISIGLLHKIILSFPQKWWTDRLSSYTLFWKGEDKKRVSAEDSWMTQIVFITPPMGSDNTLTLWLNGDTAQRVESLPDEVVKRKSMELLRKFLGANMTIPEPTGILRSQWHSNPYTRGSYTYDNLVAQPFHRVDLGKPLLDSSGRPRVLFAGEATNEVHFSTVHGAAETGHREAQRLLQQFSKI